ncbi:transposase [Dyadobacter sp. CY347]|uniref:transposase n=1 Tax=Dyadobacter sp. CY347 TaxID=2909336 RepID=UPI001F34B83D|nr:transposase [Dyadobacter sp. CY347]MCF2487516.1 transposase [Dyadobacter sp. CY347]
MDSGKQANDVARENGISKASLYNWRKKYSGMGALELAELKAIKEENCRLKHMYAELDLITGWQKRSSKKALKPAQKRLIASDISQEAGFSIERACSVLLLSTGVFYYKTVKNDLPVIDMLNELAEEHPTRGFDWYYGNLRNRGLQWNRKRVLRIYRSMDLKLRRKRKRRILKRLKQPLIEAKALNETWSGRRAVWIL